jgi:hypothetical protein
MGEREIVQMLLERDTRIDIFCASLLGFLDAVQAILTFLSKLIDARGPHGFALLLHAQISGKDAEPVRD